MEGTRVEMNSIESFCFYLKNLWTADATKRLRFRILDSVVYQDGRPHCWLFTSQKTGEIMRKKGERLQNVSEIVASFKHKSHAFKGYKESELRTKIAIVWFLRSERELSSYLVDEVELGRILSSHLPEIIATQVYIGGYHAKGNGIFAHKVWRLRSGQMKHQTYENIDSAIESNLSQFSAYSKQLVVQDFQADILRSFAQTISRHIEHAASANLEFLHFQVVFDSSWNPYLIAVRDIIFMDAPQEFEEDRNRVIFVDGKVPTMPPLHENSLLLPVRISDYTLPSDHREREDATRAQQQQQQQAEDDQNATGERKKSKWGILRTGVTAFSMKKSSKPEIVPPKDTKPTLHSMQFKNGSQTINIPPPDLGKGPTYFNSHQQQVQQETNVPASTTSRSNASNTTSLEKSNSNHHPAGKTKQASKEESVHLHKFVDNPMATGNLIVKDFNYRDEKKKTKTRPVSASAVLQSSSNTNSQADYKYEEGDADMLDHTLLHDDPDNEQKGLSNPRTGVKYGSHRHHMLTELKHIRDDHEEEEHSLVGGEKTLARHLTVRRPISAPHNSRKKYEGMSTNRRNVVSLVRHTTMGKFSKTNLQTSKLFDPEVDDGPNPWAGSSLWKDNPISGVTCFGDYCWFYENASKKLEEADRRDKAKREGKEVPAPDSKLSSQQHLYQAHSVHCPYKLTYKSILLCRSEIKFLENAPLDDAVDSLLVRQKLADLEDEQLYTYFVRRHVNRVAQKCQEEARKFSVSMPQAPYSVWDDINAVYRRVVYSDALSKVHPSRFYYTVPLCESCYQIYHFLDMQREVTIMHNPEQNAVLLDGTAPLSARSRPHSASNKSRPNSANNASRSNSRPNSANATSSARLQPSQKANDDDEMMLSIDEEEINPISNQNELKSNKLRVSKILQHRQANISEDEEEAREGVIFADVRKSTDPTTNKRRPVSASNAVRSSSTSNAIAANRNNNKADHRGSRSHSALPSPKPNIKQNNSNVAITRDGSGFKVTLSTEPNHAASNPPSSSPKRDNDPKYWLYEQPQQQQQQAVGAYEDPVSNQEYEAPPRPVMQPVHAAPNYYLYANADNIATPADLSSAVHVMQPAYAQQSTNKSTDAVDGTRVKNTYGYYSLPFDKAPYFPTGQTPFVVIPAANFMQPYPNAQYNPAPHWQQQVAQPQVAPSYYYSEQGIQSQHQQQVQPRDTFVEVKRQQLPQTRIQSSTFQDADEAMSPLRYDSNAHRQVQEPPPPSEVNRSPQLAIDTPPKYAYGSDNSPSSLAPMELSQSFSPFSPLHMASMDFESPMQPVR